MTATDVQLREGVVKTSAEIMGRYRANRNWRLYEKEWVYKNFPPAGKSWMDFGCGTGEILTQLALLGATSVVGVDVTPGLLEQARQRAVLDGVSDKIQLFCGDIATITPPPVDIVLSFAVLHHLPDHLNEAMVSVRRLLKPGGIFIAVEPLCYMPLLERMRQISGVPQDELDPGERKLTGTDLETIERHFTRSERVHFRLFSRLGRLWPGLDHMFRRVDSVILPFSAFRSVAGTVIQVCHTD